MKGKTKGPKRVCEFCTSLVQAKFSMKCSWKNCPHAHVSGSEHKINIRVKTVRLERHVVTILQSRELAI